MDAASAVLAQADWGHMRGWDGGWMWIWGTLMMLTWAVIVATAVWWVVRSRDGGGARRAEEILDERLATGELSVEEYRERRDALG